MSPNAQVPLQGRPPLQSAPIGAAHPVPTSANDDAAAEDQRVLINPLWAINAGVAVFFLAVTFIMAIG